MTRTFTALFTTVYCLLATAVIITAAWIEPFDGDLTRLGRVSENDFGWNQAQLRFEKDTTEYHQRSHQAYQGHQDVLVFGDSFSHFSMVNADRRFGWQSFVQHRTGLSFFTYHLQHTDIDQWLTNTPNDAYPDYVVFEEIERTLKSRPILESTCTLPAGSKTSLSTDVTYPDGMTPYHRRPKKLLELGTAIHMIKGKLNPKEKVFRLPLTRDDLFSNNLSNQVLIFKDDVKSNQFASPERLDQIACYLAHLKQKLESNGRTKFITAIVPDKLTVYAPYLQSPPNGMVNLLAELEARGLPVMRLDLLYQQRLAQGTTDLYLPNDTHWGAEGSLLFANAVQSAMVPTD